MAILLHTDHSEIGGAEVSTKAVYQVHPLRDPRWAELVGNHTGSSVFHTVQWLEALQRTYGYEPTAYTTSPPGTTLENGVVFCRVTSWLTGRRLVSLPFSDHCEPLMATAEDEQLFASTIEQALHREKLRYAEIRATGGDLFATSRVSRSTRAYCFHRLDLRPDLTTLFRNCHKSSTQRKILRAEREGLTCEIGRSESLLNAFWVLLLMTRRRHRIPPQPQDWFRNLIACFGEALQIRVAFKDKRPVAAILTLRHKDTIVYKYGCSDARCNTLGGTQLLFWKAIQDARRDGLHVFDLGRTECDNAGLITFKDRLGSARSLLTYARFSLSPPSDMFGTNAAKWAGRIAKGMVPYLPDRILEMIGSALYRHVA